MRKRRRLTNHISHRHVVRHPVLALEDGTRWCFHRTLYNSHLVDQLAKIAGLDDATRHIDGICDRIIIRSAGKPDSASIHPNASDWTASGMDLLRIRRNPEKPDIVLEILRELTREEEYLVMMSAFFPVYMKSIQGDGLPLHAGLVDFNGRGVVLAGTGNSGKSTCCRRLPPPWRALCDDETLVVKTPQGEYRAHPFPTWSEYLWQTSSKTWETRSSRPVDSIFFITRAETDRVQPMGRGETTALLTRSADEVMGRLNRDYPTVLKQELRKRLFDNAMKLARRIRGFCLHVSPDGKFWKKMEDVVGDR